MSIPTALLCTLLASCVGESKPTSEASPGDVVETLVPLEPSTGLRWMDADGQIMTTTVDHGVFDDDGLLWTLDTETGSLGDKVYADPSLYTEPNCPGAIYIQARPIGLVVELYDHVYPHGSLGLFVRPEGVESVCATYYEHEQIPDSCLRVSPFTAPGFYGGCLAAVPLDALVPVVTPSPGAYAGPMRRIP